jgi:hypothetical protein
LKVNISALLSVYVVRVQQYASCKRHVPVMGPRSCLGSVPPSTETGDDKFTLIFRIGARHQTNTLYLPAKALETQTSCRIRVPQSSRSMGANRSQTFYRKVRHHLGVSAIRLLLDLCSRLQASSYHIFSVKSSISHQNRAMCHVSESSSCTTFWSAAFFVRYTYMLPHSTLMVE